MLLNPSKFYKIKQKISKLITFSLLFDPKLLFLAVSISSFLLIFSKNEDNFSIEILPML